MVRWCNTIFFFINSLGLPNNYNYPHGTKNHEQLQDHSLSGRADKGEKNSIASPYHNFLNVMIMKTIRVKVS